METKFTKGNWKLQKDNSILSLGFENVLVAQICSANNNDVEKNANALLISKAPEMLEMLEKCREYFLLKTDEKSDERADAIGELIKQATEI